MSEQLKRFIYIMIGVSGVSIGWANLHHHDPLAMAATLLGGITLVNGVVWKEAPRG